MSTKKPEWLFGLEDKMSGPASVAEKTLELLERRIKSVVKAEAEISGPKKERLTFARLNLEIQRDQDSLHFPRVGVPPTRGPDLPLQAT